MKIPKPNTKLKPILENKNFHEVSHSRVNQKLRNEWEKCQTQMLQEESKPFDYTSWKNLIAESPSLPTSPIGISCSKGESREIKNIYKTDSFTINILGIAHEVRIFGLLEGADGMNAANFSKKRLNETLKFFLEQFNERGLTTGGIWNALKITFAEIYENWVDIIFETFDISTTSICISMLLDGNIWTASTGSSRSILVTNTGRVFQLSEDILFPRAKRRTQSLSKSKIRASSRPKITKIALNTFKEGGHLLLFSREIAKIAEVKQLGAAITEYQHIPAQSLAHLIVCSAVDSGGKKNLSLITIKIPREHSRSIENAYLLEEKKFAEELEIGSEEMKEEPQDPIEIYHKPTIKKKVPIQPTKTPPEKSKRISNFFFSYF